MAIVSKQTDRGLRELNVTTIFRVHLVIIAVLLMLHIVISTILLAVEFRYFNDVRRVIDLNAEHGISNLFSAFALAICGCVASLIASRTASSGKRFMARGWVLCAAILFFLAIDEGAALHDLLSGKVSGILGMGEFRGILYFAWVVPYAFAVVLVLALLARFALALPVQTRLRLAIAAMIYVGAAIGMELPSAHFADNYRTAGGSLTGDGDLIPVMVMHAIEEVGEMVAVALALRALLLHIVHYLPDTRLSFGDKRYESPSVVALLPANAGSR